MKRIVLAAAAAAIVLTLATPTEAGRPDKSWKGWFGNVYGGFEFPLDEAGDLLDDGWTLGGSATYWPESWPVGLDLGLSYMDNDVSNDFIRRLNEEILENDPSSGTINGGDTSIWSATADVIWSPNTGRVSPYARLGVGAFRIRGKLTTQGVVVYPPYCQPFWPYYCFPGGVGPGNLLVTDESTTEFGYTVGLGLNIEIGNSGSQLFLEVKHHWIETEITTKFVPFVVGYRW